MRYALALAAAALVAPAAVRAADPPVTFQTLPVNRVLDDMRAAADLIGGERAVKSFNAAVKEKFGDKGFDGLDLNRPVAGYALLAPKAEDATLVVAFPVANEKAFLGLADRVLGFEPKDLGKGLYAVPGIDEKRKGRLKFADGHAYLALGAGAEAALDEKALVPVNRLVDPADQSIAAGKFHFDRLTPEVKAAVPGMLADLKKAVSEIDPAGVGAQEAAIFKPLAEQFEKMVGRYVLLLGGADAAAVRLALDVPSGALSVESTLTAKPDTALAKLIAARKPTGNKFAGLLTPDTVAGFKTRLPFFNEELRAGAVGALEEGQKMVGQAGGFKDLLDELFKGLIRTVKTGEVDVAGGFRGPDKNGDFTGVLAVAFEDPAGLEKEFRKLIENMLPADEQGRFKWDADKAGKVNIHTYKMPGGRGWLDFSKPFGDDRAVIAFAFAPHGVFVAVGPDPVPVMKGMLALKPADSPVLDVLVNPARMKKFVERTGEPGADVERALGAEDKLLSAMSLTVSGGKELRVRYAINLRLLPRAIASEGGGPVGPGAPPPAPPAVKP